MVLAHFFFFFGVVNVVARRLLRVYKKENLIRLPISINMCQSRCQSFENSSAVCVDDDDGDGDDDNDDT